MRKNILFILLILLCLNTVTAQLFIPIDEGYDGVKLGYYRGTDYAFLSQDNNWTGTNIFKNFTWINYEQFNVTGQINATGIMAENIYTQSKVINESENYLDKIKDKDKLKTKETHYSYVDNIMGSGYNGLDMEERVVVLEGAVNELFTVLCNKNILKKEDGCMS